MPENVDIGILEQCQRMVIAIVEKHIRQEFDSDTSEQLKEVIKELQMTALPRVRMGCIQIDLRFRSQSHIQSFSSLLLEGTVSEKMWKVLSSNFMKSMKKLMPEDSEKKVRDLIKTLVKRLGLSTTISWSDLRSIQHKYAEITLPLILDVVPKLNGEALEKEKTSQANNIRCFLKDHSMLSWPLSALKEELRRYQHQQGI